MSQNREKPNQIDIRAGALRDYLQEIVYGGSDGIVTTLAVISGFAGAGSGNMELATTVVVLFGFANLFADASSMGLGNFLSVRSEKAVARQQFEDYVRSIQAQDIKTEERLVALLQKKGYREHEAQSLAAIFITNTQHSAQLIMDEEVGVSNSAKENAVVSSLFTFVSFVIFGSAPLIPYLFDEFALQFWVALLSSLTAMLILGLLRTVATKERWYRSVLETIIVGGISAAIAFGVGVVLG